MNGHVYMVVNKIIILFLGKNDPINYAFPLQITTIESHRKNVCEINGKSGNHICERSQNSCLNVFTRYCMDNNTMSDCQLAVYKNMLTSMRKPDHILYINTPLDICLQRIRRRKRPEEDQLDIDYLNILHRYHMEWLANEQIPVTILNYKNNMEHIIDVIRNVLAEDICNTHFEDV